MTTEKIVLALKQQLKAQGFTYVQIGEHLGISASSVKRLFSDRNFTLQRIEDLCVLLGIDISHLIQLAEENQSELFQLDWEQEDAIVKDPKLLLVGVCLLNRCSFEEILNKYEYQRTELVRFFTVFDRFGVIELLPENRYRLKISTNFTWQPQGPIQQFFVRVILGQYLTEKTQDTGNINRFLWNMLSQSSAQELTKKINHLIEDYILLAEKDKKLAMADKLTSSMMVVFKEDWEPDIFKTMYKT
jgi:transcriptional regulator with XRE-family HTH domain